ncbi:MAG: hypothetical protein AAGE96_05395 [Cyanobacteria bacterium P01_G01_bin.19]
MFRKLLLSTAIAFSIANPALADWQFTKWGMTQEELLTVSPINVKNSRFDPECPSTAPLSSNYEVSEFLKFTACYGFDRNSDSLNYVHLYLRNYAARTILYEALVAKYGRPQNINRSDIGLAWYKWRNGNNLITLTDDLTNIHSPNMFITYKSLQPELEVEKRL